MSDEIKLSRRFIEQEVPLAKPVDVAVYLMMLAVGQDFKKVAEKLNIKESDVLRAWAYWLDRGGVQGTEAKTKTETERNTQTEAKPAGQAQTEKTAAQQAAGTAAPKRLLVCAEPPVYSPAEMAQYRKQAEVQQLFHAAQQKLGKMLTHKDMSTIFSFHDWLGLPLDVIELLFSYCMANGAKGIWNIEKEALRWAEDGINTVDKATEYIEYRTSGIRAVMQAFGQTSRTPVEKEKEFIRKWIWQYKLPIDIVKNGCERTVLKTGKVSFEYADSILTSWHHAGVKTAADIAKLDEAFAAGKAVKAQQTPPAATQKEPPKPKQNRFINYTQSEWDFEELERLEREQRDKW